VSSFDPFFLLDLLVGPIVAIKLKIVVHYAIGLGGMYWCSRQIGLSGLASFFAAGTFIFSSWLALHLGGGHLWVLTTVYIPWVVGLLYGACRQLSNAIWAGVVLAGMVLEGGGAHVVTLLCISCGLLSACWAIRKRSVRPIAALLLMMAFGAGFSAAKLLPVPSCYGSIRDTRSSALRAGRGSGTRSTKFALHKPMPGLIKTELTANIEPGG
jgi:hypothetical protein